MKKKLLISCLVIMALLSAVAVAASAADLFGTQDALAAVEAATTAPVTEAVTTEATSPATTTTAATEAQYTSWTDRSGVMHYVDAAGTEPGVVYVTYFTDENGKTEWVDENGKNPPRQEYSVEERAQQKIDSLYEEQKWVQGIIQEKAALTSERELLLSGKNEADLTDAEKTRLSEIDLRLAYIHLNYEPLRPEMYEPDTYFIQQTEMELEMLRILEQNQYKGVDNSDAALNRLRIEIYQTCLDMFENGASIKEVLIYQYTQLDGLYDQLRAMGY